MSVEERILSIYGADVSVFSDGSVWIHRGSRNRRRFGNTTDKGYKVVLIRDQGVSRTVFVHRLVAMAFVPNPDEKPQVNHLNGNKSDNRPENLEWCTNAENMHHRFTVLDSFGRGRSIRCVETGEIFRTINAASKATGISRANISSCINGRRRRAGGYSWEIVRGD